MAGSVFGKQFKVSTFGESHGKALGVVVDGVPAGLFLCEEDIQKFLARRKPGQSAFTTQRNEADEVEIGAVGKQRAQRLLAQRRRIRGGRRRRGKNSRFRTHVV